MEHESPPRDDGLFVMLLAVAVGLPLILEVPLCLDSPSGPMDPQRGHGAGLYLCIAPLVVVQAMALLGLVRIVRR